MNKKVFFSLLACFVLIVVAVHRSPYNFPSDDSLFYLQIASHIYAGHGSTFHGITATNGYHPLWMFFCVMSFFISGGSKLGALHVAMCIQQVMAASIIFICAAILNRLLEDRRHKIAGIAFSIGLLTPYFLTGLYASEAHVNGLFVLLSCWAALNAFHSEKRRALSIAGLLTGLAVLARLDNIFFAGSLLLGIILWRHGFRWLRLNAIYDAAVLGFSFLAVVVPYLVINSIQFGHLMPISGAIKSTFPRLGWNFDAVSELGYATFIYAFLSLVFAGIMRLSKAQKFLIRILSFATCFHSLYLLIFTVGATKWGWYYVVGVLNIALTFGFFVSGISKIIFERRSDLNSSLLWTVKTVACIFLIFAVARALGRSNNPDAIRSVNTIWSSHRKVADDRWQVQAGRWLKEKLPKESRVLVSDYPGTLAYLSDLSIIPTDGLVNDFAYSDIVLRDGIKTYLRQNNITYCLGSVPDSKNIEIFAPLYKKRAGTINLSGGNFIAHLPDVIQHPETPDWSLYKIPED